MTDEEREHLHESEGGAEGEPDGPPLLPYTRAQRRLRVDGVAFGRAVTRHREAEGWSVRTLSKKSGVPLTTVAKLERGETSEPDVEVATALALTFGFSSPGTLLGEAGTARPKRAGAPESPSLEATFASVLRAALGVLDERGLAPGEALGAAGLPGAVAAGGPAPLAINFVVVGAGGVLLLDPKARADLGAAPTPGPG